jgi:hypothetical protein
MTQPLSQILAKIEATRQKAKDRQPVELPAVPAAPPKVVQLPLWPEPVRGVPNSILRSALFGAIKRGRRMFMQGEPVASYEGVTILQTGPRLDQADLDVWEQCMHLARTGGLGTRIQFAAHGFLKTIGRDTGKSQHEWLRNAFRRLASSVVEVKDGKRAYFGPMLHHGTRDDETGHYCIEINPAIVSLYGSDGWSAVEFEQRKALKRQPLAQWLHGFYTTHAAPYPIKVETIRRLSGSETEQLFHFREKLRKALGAVAEATGWTWEIDDADLVLIDKKPTGSQARHLIRKKLGTA